MKLRLIEKQTSDYVWTREETKHLKTYLIENCGPYFDEIGSLTNALFRGVVRPPIDADLAAFERATRDYRRPLSSSEEQNRLFVDLINSKGLVANRNNSIFTSGDYEVARSYGSVFVVLPVGEFNYTWSPELGDWYSDLSRHHSAASYISSAAMAAKNIRDDDRHAKSFEASAKHELDKVRTIARRNNLSLSILNDHLGDDEIIEYLKSQPRIEPVVDKALQEINDSFVSRVQIFGDDGSLPKAIHSGSEVMIKAANIVYVDMRMYEMMFGVEL